MARAKVAKGKRHPGGRPRKQNKHDIVFAMRMSFALFGALQIAARLRGRAVPDLVRELVRDFLEEFSFTNTKVMITKTLAVTQLIKQLIAFSRVSKLAMQAHKTGGGTSGEERRLKRARMLEMGMDAFAQLYKIAQSERVAEHSKFRIQAYQVMTRVGFLNLMLLKSTTDEELLERMFELEDENARLEQMAKEIQTRASQEAQSVQQSTSSKEDRK